MRALRGYKMYFVYIIENEADRSWYIGFTDDLERRLGEHNGKIGGKYTRSKVGGWEPIYYEAYKNKTDALGRETFLKSGAGRRFLKKQLRHFLEIKPK